MTAWTVLVGGLGVAIGAVDGLEHIEAGARQRHDHHLPDGGGIVDGQDGLAHAGLALGMLRLVKPEIAVRGERTGRVLSRHADLRSADRASTPWGGAASVTATCPMASACLRAASSSWIVVISALVMSAVATATVS